MHVQVRGERDAVAGEPDGRRGTGPGPAIRFPAHSAAWWALKSCIDAPVTSSGLPGAYSLTASRRSSWLESQSRLYEVTLSCPGRVTVTSCSRPCTTSRMRLTSTCSGVLAARYCSVRSLDEFQSSSDIDSPATLYQSIRLALGVRTPGRPKRTGRRAGFSRRKAMRNLLGTLLLSAGVPM